MWKLMFWSFEMNVVTIKLSMTGNLHIFVFFFFFFFSSSLALSSSVTHKVQCFRGLIFHTLLPDTGSIQAIQLRFV